MDALVRADRQVATLRGKIARLEAMLAEADERRRASPDTSPTSMPAGSPSTVRRPSG